ncbi:MAG: DUF481 domain-containing protein [Algicola sp.]|nr:DUF481 domain-containing protein [Algicola sp.]
MKTIVYFLLLISGVLHAQINESSIDSLEVKANLSLSGFFQSGNVETVIFRAKSDVIFKPWRKWVFKTQNSYVYQEFGKEKADEDILSLNFLYINPDRRVYPLFLGFVSTNFRREIDVRVLYGAGVTFEILKHDKNWLKLSVSSEYERTNFKQARFNITDYNGTAIVKTFRGTLWINGKYHVFKDKIVLSHESYVQPSLEYADNYRWQADLSLEFPLLKFLNFKINYKHTFESLVITNQNREDQFLTFGFTLKNYK